METNGKAGNDENEWKENLAERSMREKERYEGRKGVRKSEYEE